MEGLFIPAFIAGVLTFLAPCTLPLLPGYIAFISGVAPEQLDEQAVERSVRWRIILNGALYVVGFSVVFIALGLLFGLGGSALFQYQHTLARMGGVLVLLFGVFMVVGDRIPFMQRLQRARSLRVHHVLVPGKPLSSLAFGAVFALGWSPCVGPVLGSVLLLASTTATALHGAVLLSIFAIGLGLPFMLVAVGIGAATHWVRSAQPYLRVVAIIGGIFLIFLGILILTDMNGLWAQFLYSTLGFFNYEGLLDHL